MKTSERDILNRLVPILYVQIMMRTLVECDEHNLINNIKQKYPWITDHLNNKEDLPINRFLHIADMIAKEASYPDIGLEIGKRFSINIHGAVGDLLISAPNLDLALEKAIRFYKLNIAFLPVAIEIADNECQLVIEKLPMLSTQLFQLLIDMLMCSYNKSLSIYTNNTKNFKRLWLTSPPPAGQDKYKALFGCETQYNCDVVKIAIPMSLLEKDSPHYSPELFQKYLEFCQLESTSLDRNTSLSIRAANLIKKSPSLDWSLGLAAQKLNISVSTLKRKLRAEGVSFKDILFEARFELAKQWIDKGDMRILDIAHELTYVNASNFAKAFKRWVGVTPSEYKNRQR